MRLNKFISETGMCSRREADAWIDAGRVTINGVPAALGTQVEEGDEVCVDGRPVGAPKRHVYIALNKPVGITCTTERRVRGNIVDFVGQHDFDDDKLIAVHACRGVLDTLAAQPERLA